MEEKTLRTERIYEGRVVTLDVLDVALSDGSTSKREVIRHAGAVAVLPKLKDGRFLLVQQYRKPLDRIMLEVPAGTRDVEDESAETCAHRELREETGYQAERMVPLGTTYPSPGYVSERIDLFFAECGEEQGAQDTDHDEHVETVTLSGEEIRAKILSGEIQDAKTVALWWMFENQSGAV